MRANRLEAFCLRGFLTGDLLGAKNETANKNSCLARLPCNVEFVLVPQASAAASTSQTVRKSTGFRWQTTKSFGSPLTHDMSQAQLGEYQADAFSEPTPALQPAPASCYRRPLESGWILARQITASQELSIMRASRKAVFLPIGHEQGALGEEVRAQVRRCDGIRESMCRSHTRRDSRNARSTRF